MNVLIAGASGFIGRKLVAALQANHTITVLGRDRAILQRYFSNPINILTWEMLPDVKASAFDAVINLCGYNIAASRWSHAVKKLLIDSRVKTTTALVDWAIKDQAKPHFICANAVGIYGMQDNEDKKELDEDSPIDFENPCDFLSEIGIRWQQALQPAIDYGMNVTIARFGVVLGKGEGVLKKLALSYYFGLGSTLGDGKQMMSWVHIDDVVGAILFLLNKPELAGAFNITSPNPASQAEFARTLATVMHRPLLLNMPAFVIRMLFGEMGECLLLKGQRVLPSRLIASGYEFCYPELMDALRHEYT
ncbi:MAG: TIGR01777 family protein [Legionellales bacterium RIFCSPHIGHO2_12_FULL_37_14]|nr:MAG: TIGR01777 family protein [Legionellales bacterium RIFCSPHIGHO2_12_FULL_37_14]